MRLTWQRRRQGKHHIRLLVNDDEIDFLLARGYPLKRTDNRSVARRWLLACTDEAYVWVYEDTGVGRCPGNRGRLLQPAPFHPRGRRHGRESWLPMD
jgi:hypothetical protein